MSAMFDGGNSDSKNANGAIAAPIVGVWRSLHLAGVCKSWSRFCVAGFGKTVQIFSRLIYFIKIV
jgi:hypothetical protein